MTDLTIFHGGALGDLALTLQLALRLPGVSVGGTLYVISRTDPGDLSGCRPSIRRVSSEGIGLHWLFAEGDDPPPRRLHECVAGSRVLNALGGVDSDVHRRLGQLDARTVYSFDSRPGPDSSAHITLQWQNRLEEQGLLIPKCIHQHRGGPRLFVPDELRQRGRVGRLPQTENTLRPTAAPGGGRYMCGTGVSPVDAALILIHPGSGGRAKCWPLRCFINVARRLRESGEEVCFIVGPAEIERWSAEKLSGIRAEFTLIESPAPDELLTLLAGARVLIGNDAGPAHLAALLGTPTVTIFGSTSPTIWRPLGAKARFIRGKPESHPDDWSISPARVVEIARR